MIEKGALSRQGFAAVGSEMPPLQVTVRSVSSQLRYCHLVRDPAVEEEVCTSEFSIFQIAPQHSYVKHPALRSFLVCFQGVSITRSERPLATFALCSLLSSTSSTLSNQEHHHPYTQDAFPWSKGEKAISNVDPGYTYQPNVSLEREFSPIVGGRRQQTQSKQTTDYFWCYATP